MPSPFSFAPVAPDPAAPIDYRQFMRANPWGSWAPNDIASMTHQAEGPNPAQPYAQGALRALQTGLGFATGGLQGAGVPMPDWMRSNPVQSALQNPDNALAMGMANPTPRIAGNPAMIAAINADIEQGLSRKAIVEKRGIGNATLGRYLDKTGQKTAGAENPSVWTPETEAQLIEYRRQGVSHPDIAQKMGLSFKQVDSKVYALKDAGRMPDDAPRWEPFLNDPKKTAEFVQDVNEGWSQSALNRKYGWASSGASSTRISQLQERGDIQNYVPQGGMGLTPAGRTPTMAPTNLKPMAESDEAFNRYIMQILGERGQLGAK